MKNPKLELLHARRSVRKFLPDPVPEDAVGRILAAAHAAPSAHNSRPWRFAVVREAPARRSLAEAMAAAFARDAEAAGRNPEAVRARNERSIARISGAPLAVAVFLDEACLPADAGGRMDAERMLLVQSVAAAVQNLLLAAAAEGLAGCWICAPAFCPQVVRENLNLPETWSAQALVLLGSAAEQPAAPEGTPFAEVVQWR
jgi:coenzyme F420-0:L-glutamate ligase / coenzyme F420-1:gamma-L-glutamate ligase